MHGIDQAEPFGHTTLANELLDVRRDVDEAASSGDFEPEMFGKGFQ